MSGVILNRKIKEIENEIDDILITDMIKSLDDLYEEKYNYYTEIFLKMDKRIDEAFDVIKYDKLKAAKLTIDIIKDILKYGTEYCDEDVESIEVKLKQTDPYKMLIEKITTIRNLRCFYPKEKNNIDFRVKKNLHKCNRFITMKISEYNRIDNVINITYDNMIQKYYKLSDEIHKILDELCEDEEKEFIKFEKIFNHRDMDKLLKSRGLEPVRQKGSHKVYTNGTKTTVVPQHTLGKALSYAIQKQIG